MTEGERFVEEIPRKTRFYDRNERRTYELTRAVAARLVDDPSLLQRGLSYMDRHMKDDPSQASFYATWLALLRRDAKVVARLLLEDTPNGALLRDTQPVFCVLPTEDREKVLARARVDDAEIVVR